MLRMLGLASLFLSGCLLPDLAGMSGGSALRGAASTIDAPTAVAGGCPGLCDDFERTTALGPIWTGVDCKGGTLSVDHQLKVAYPAQPTGQFSSCTLDGIAAPTSSRIRIELDYRAETPFSGPDYQAIAFVSYDAPANGAGVSTVVHEIMLDANGALHVGVVSTVRAPAGGTDYPFQIVAETTVPSVRAGSICHLVFDADFANGTASASSTCDGLTTTTVPQKPLAQKFTAVQPHVSLGYSVVSSEAIPQRSMTWDNLILRTFP